MAGGGKTAQSGFQPVSKWFKILAKEVRKHVVYL